MRILPAKYQHYTDKKIPASLRQNAGDILIKNRQKKLSFTSKTGEPPDNPIILEPKDISINKPKVYRQITKKANDDKYYRHGFFIDARNDKLMPIQGESTSWHDRHKGNPSHFIYNA